MHLFYNAKQINGFFFFAVLTVFFLTVFFYRITLRKYCTSVATDGKYFQHKANICTQHWRFIQNNSIEHR